MSLLGFFKDGKGLFGKLNKLVTKDSVLFIKTIEATNEIKNKGEDGLNKYITAKSLSQDGIDRIISGNGIVQDVDYSFIGSSYVWLKRGVEYSNEITHFTVDGSDAVLFRKDAVVLTYDENGDGVMVAKKGADAATEITALPPIINQETELLLTVIPVNPATTSPDNVADIILYDEDESTLTPNTATVIGTATGAFVGAKCIGVTDFTSGESFYVKFASDFNPKIQNSFLTKIQATSGAWQNFGTIKIALIDNADNVISNYVIIDSRLINNAGNPFSFDSDKTDWQSVNIPMNVFNPTSETARGIVVLKDDNRGTDSFKMDLIRIQGGIVTPSSFEKTKLSEFENDGADGLNPFISDQALIDLLNVNSIQLDETPNVLTPNAGLIQWNSTEDTADLHANGVIYQLGQEIAPLVRNNTGSTITNGTPVMFAGTLGASGRVLITPAIADGSIPSSYILGTATEDIANGQDGHVTWFGKVRDIDTTGTPYGEVWADQNILYVSPTTAGYLTNVKPEAPNAQIFIGVVINAHATNGTLFVRPSWRGNITDLDDVNGTTLDTDGQIVVWDDTLKVFDFTKNINDYLLISSVAITDNLYKINQVNLDNVTAKNADTYLTIPTSDGSGQIVHPSVIYFKDGWNGYKYWMAMTPYPFYDAQLENPEIVVSNDNKTWIVPVGGTNPLVPTPVGILNYNSDPELCYNPDTNTLWLLFRETFTDPSFEDKLFVMSTTDGFTWSAPIEILNTTTSLIVSPSLLYEDGVYTIHLVESGLSLENRKVIKMTSSSADSGWSLGTAIDCTLDGAIPLGSEPWHLDVTKTNGEYHLFLCTAPPDITVGNNAIIFGSSLDGETFRLTSDNILTPYDSFGFDSYITYRGSAVYLEDKAKYGFWYSATNSSPNTGTWRVGYTEIDLNTQEIEVLSPNLKLGLVLNVDNPLTDYYNISLPLNSSPYTLGETQFGGKTVVKFNRSTEPIFTGMEKLIGMSDTFVADTDMYAFITDIGLAVEYFIQELGKTPFVIPNISTSILESSFVLNGNNPYSSSVFSPDNTKLYVASGTRIYQYDVIIGSPNNYKYKGKNFTTGIIGQPIYWIALSDDGSKYTVGSVFHGTTYTYDMIDGDISNSVLDEAFAIPEAAYHGKYVNGGTEFHYIYRFDRNKIKVRQLTTPYQMSSWDTVTEIAIVELTSGQSFEYSNGGLKMYVIDVNDYKIHQYTLSGAYDPLTRVYDTDLFTIGTPNLVSGMTFMKGTNRKWIASCNGDETIKEYTW